nr:MAG TPA: Terminase [Caudoviricetes sp.]
MPGCGQRTGERLLTFLFKELGGVFYLASDYLINTVNGYEDYVRRQGIDEQLLEAYKQAIYFSMYKDRDNDYGVKIAGRVKKLYEKFIFDTTGGTSWDLEKYAFKNKAKYQILDDLYEVILVEAQNKNVDSYLRYIEKKREPKERFYMPRRKQFLKIGLVDGLQGMIDDKYDMILISLIPGSGKTSLEKFFLSGVIGWFPKDFNLFYSHSSDITRMFYDGEYDIVTNAEEYTWHEIFPKLKVNGQNAKMEQFNVGKYKPFPSVQCTSVGSKNAGKVRASKFLLVDDMIGGIEEALNKNTLDKLWDKYAVDARQRKIQDTDGNNCKEIHIATRWSVYDVIGRIQKMYEGNDRVKTIAVPDVDPVTGESNFDYEYSGFTVDFFADQQLLMDDVSYRCLYKQEPIEREGLLFPEDKIRRYLNLPHGEPEIITGQCDTKGKGTDFFVLPVLQKYGEDYYCVDCVCDNTADYEMQYENAANILVNNMVQECEFERNAGGDRVAMEVNKRVEQKGWICNITDTPTETNKEARIYQCSAWILQHVIFKDKSMYSPKEPYGIMMQLLSGYSVSDKKQLDDVPDVFSNFAIRVTSGSRVATVEAIQNPFWGGYR